MTDKPDTVTDKTRNAEDRMEAVRQAPLLSDLRDAICFVERHDHPESAYCNAGRAQAYRIREALIARYQYRAAAPGSFKGGVVETVFSPWYRSQCVTPLPGCWAGDGSEDNGRVTAAARAHTLETGHETSVTCESSRHYRLPAAPEGATR